MRYTNRHFTYLLTYWGARPKGREQGWGSWGWAATPPHQLRVWGAPWAPPAGFTVEPRPPKGVPLFSALRMASPDTIILLIVDYHAVIGASPMPPLRTPLAHCSDQPRCHWRRRIWFFNCTGCGEAWPVRNVEMKVEVPSPGTFGIYVWKLCFLMHLRVFYKFTVLYVHLLSADFRTLEWFRNFSVYTLHVCWTQQLKIIKLLVYIKPLCLPWITEFVSGGRLPTACNAVDGPPKWWLTWQVCQ